LKSFNADFVALKFEKDSETLLFDKPCRATRENLLKRIGFVEANYRNRSFRA